MIVNLISQNEIKVIIENAQEINAVVAPTIDLSGLTWTEPPRLIQAKIVDDNSDVGTDNGKMIFAIPAELNEYKLYSCHAYITTPSNNGNIEITIKNITKNVEMLSQNIIIEEGKYTSYTSSVQPIINQNNALVNTGDLILIETILAGENAKGLGVLIRFKKE